MEFELPSRAVPRNRRSGYRDRPAQNLRPPTSAPSQRLCNRRDRLLELWVLSKTLPSNGLTPDSPGSGVLIPQSVEHLHFAVGVHALPESVVLVNRELALLRQLHQQACFQCFTVAFDQV